MTMLRCHATRPSNVRDHTASHCRRVGTVAGRRLPLRVGGRPAHSYEPGQFRTRQGRDATRFAPGAPHLEQHPVGTIGADVGFKLASNPDTVRGPDIAFVRRDRVPTSGRGFFTGAPDLVIEVLSPDDRSGAVRAKTEQYLATGVPVVVIVDPEERTATTFRPGFPPVALASPNDVPDLSDAITGFRCPLHEIFQ